MQHNKIKTLFLAAAMVTSGMMMGADARAEGITAAALANTCAGCHGTNGVAVGPAMPTIAGQPAAHLVNMMKEFKSGERPATIMDRIAKGYSDEEITELSKYLATQKWGNNVANARLSMKTGTPFNQVDDALVAKGAKLHESLKCKKCHEDNGRSMEDDTPRVAGQWQDYLLIKMQDYKNPDMKVPQPKKMKKNIDNASLEELEAIAHFYASQK
ncbi:sulfide dehydrogenase (flavocytochrome), cytochrome c subunit [Magnetococcus marinus MC-1]|uniref:Sulfide dehydrogenase (Flavocytochrome), cytochrome c subunit n=1 Tax=Magnetococcus marinus (strain ATCC BAA-1437 / JCM 17883 / MC-1) TaxID=156889 RepID=A0LBZ3_MAGMM|nr:c-type cytochrome [Magnetococcus marinus]ABK45486.1 sulfide dehydrogenase (flavocytochrome), cytochrome c subunit [Magnetococcus marinus MC-1]